MRKLFLLFCLMFLPATVVAVGTGSGGATSCTADRWMCGDWSTCSLSGQQERKCVLSYDCLGVSTPKPEETQKCTPKCTVDTWHCSEWGLCQKDNTARRTCTMQVDCPTVTTPKPTEVKTCLVPADQPSFNVNQPAPEKPTTVPAPKPSQGVGCRADTWTCASWSDSCDTEGRQARTCTMSYDCPAATTPMPDVTRPCEVLQCGNKTELRERIMCRLQLSPAALDRELTLQYLPEECRMMVNKTRQAECVKLYTSYTPCWAIESPRDRFACAQSILGLQSTPAEDMRVCAVNGGAEISCKQQARQKVFSMIKFRFYDLEERAEALGKQGASLEDVANFVAIISEKKHAFNEAPNDDVRRTIILEVRAAWQDFISKAKQSL